MSSQQHLQSGQEAAGLEASAAPGSLEVARLVEGTGAEANARMLESLSAPDRARYGVRVVRIGAAVALVAREVDVPFYNRVVGLGLQEPITDAVLDEITALYHGASIRYMLQISSLVLTTELQERLEARGLRRQDNWAQMLRGAEPPAEVRTDLRVECVGPEYAEQVAALVCDAFELPRDYTGFVTGLVGQSDWRFYLAFEGDEPVGTGALQLQPGTGYLTFGATRATHRGRGAQSAIMARRIQDALTLGCRWLVTEAVEETPDQPNPSYHNMLRAGFRLVYPRPNFVYFPPTHTGAN